MTYRALVTESEAFDAQFPTLDAHAAVVRDLQRISTALAICRNEPAANLAAAVELLEGFVADRLAHHTELSELFAAAGLSSEKQ